MTAWTGLWRKALWGWIAAACGALAFLFTLFRMIHLISWIFWILWIIGMGLVYALAVFQVNPFKWPNSQGSTPTT